MGIWLTAIILSQLACAAFAARFDRPAIWLQIILIIPLFGSFAYCVYEFRRARFGTRRLAEQWLHGSQQEKG